MEWLGLWSKSVQIAWTAPAVIAYRTSRMMLGGWPPSTRDRREYTRMGQEKVEAFVEACTAAALAWPLANVAVLEKALTPVHSRVMANNRRLSRR